MTLQLQTPGFNEKAGGGEGKSSMETSDVQLNSFFRRRGTKIAGHYIILARAHSNERRVAVRDVFDTKQ